jgi:hypothetical protein
MIALARYILQTFDRSVRTTFGVCDGWYEPVFRADFFYVTIPGLI